ncbi:hypothetical protein M5D96_009466, partial [Drosophila gunungcola]
MEMDWLYVEHTIIERDQSIYIKTTHILEKKPFFLFYVPNKTIV